MCFTCRGGSRGVGCLTELWNQVGPLKKDPHGRGGRGRGWEARFVVFYEGLRLWEAHLYVFYVSGRLSGGTMSNDAVTPGGSAKDRPSRAWGEGEGGEARVVVFYEGLRLWEARFVVFYEGLRLWEARFVLFYEGLRLWEVHLYAFHLPHLS